MINDNKQKTHVIFFGWQVERPRQERLLMVQSFHRVWCFPAGKLEEGEEEAAKPQRLFYLEVRRCKSGIGTFA